MKDRREWAETIRSEIAAWEARERDAAVAYVRWLAENCCPFPCACEWTDEDEEKNDQLGDAATGCSDQVRMWQSMLDELPSFAYEEDIAERFAWLRGAVGEQEIRWWGLPREVRECIPLPAGDCSFQHAVDAAGETYPVDVNELNRMVADLSNVRCVDCVPGGTVPVVMPSLGPSLDTAAVVEHLRSQRFVRLVPDATNDLIDSVTGERFQKVPMRGCWRNLDAKDGPAAEGVDR